MVSMNHGETATLTNGASVAGTEVLTRSRSSSQDPQDVAPAKRRKLNAAPHRNQIIEILDDSDAEAEAIVLPQNTVKQEAPHADGLPSPSTPVEPAPALILRSTSSPTRAEASRPAARMMASHSVPSPHPLEVSEEIEADDSPPEDGLVFIPHDSRMRWPKGHSIMARQMNELIKEYENLFEETDGQANGAELDSEDGDIEVLAAAPRPLKQGATLDPPTIQDPSSSMAVELVSESESTSASEFADVLWHLHPPVLFESIASVKDKTSKTEGTEAEQSATLPKELAPEPAIPIEATEAAAAAPPAEGPAATSSPEKLATAVALALEPAMIEAISQADPPPMFEAEPPTFAPRELVVSPTQDHPALDITQDNQELSSVPVSNPIEIETAENEDLIQKVEPKVPSPSSDARHSQPPDLPVPWEPPQPAVSPPRAPVSPLHNTPSLPDPPSIQAAQPEEAPPTDTAEFPNLAVAGKQAEIAVPPLRSAVKAPFLGRSLAPSQRVWHGKLSNVHAALRDNGLDTVLDPNVASAENLAPLPDHQFETVAWIFSKCAHLSKRKRVKFADLRCCWCLDVVFSTLGAMMCHLNAEHPKFTFTCSRHPPSRTIRIRAKHVACQRSPKKQMSDGQAASDSKAEAASEVPPESLKLRIPPKTFSQIAQDMVWDTTRNAASKLPSTVYKTGKTYRLRPDVQNRKRRVTVPAGRQYLATADMLPVAPGEVVSDSEDDDAERYQWESQYHQTRLLDHPDVDYSDTYVQRLWYVTARSYGVEYVSHVFETANRMITVHAPDINKHDARPSLVRHLVSLARLRTLTSGQVAELLKRYDHQIKQDPGHKPGATQSAGRDASTMGMAARVSLQCCQRSIRTISTRCSPVTLANRDHSHLDLSKLPASAIEHLQLQVDDFILWPNFFNQAERSALLTAGLKKLDRSANSAEDRRVRKQFRQKARSAGLPTTSDSFLDESAYVFQEEHFDGVITGYRETTVSEWLDDAPLELLERLYRLFEPFVPISITHNLQTPVQLVAHLLHLGSYGHIQHHVDNIAASGSILLGACLGSSRVIELEHGQDHQLKFRALLEPGSVCAWASESVGIASVDPPDLQKGKVRFDFGHAIPRISEFNGQQVGGEQRLTLMLRDRISNSA